jgi:hypothetical protein
MTELKTIKPSMIISPAAQGSTGSTRRLVVIVPPGEVDATTLTQRVWEMAKGTGAEVRLLGLYEEATQQPGLRRRLATMSAMINSGQVRSEAETLAGRDWVEAVRSRLRPDDMLVCCSSPQGGAMQKPLRQILESDLDAPMTILTGCTPEEEAPARWGAQILGWTGSIGILVGFFWLQVSLGQVPRDFGYTLLLLLTLPVEVWLIWIWNSLFS